MNDEEMNLRNAAYKRQIIKIGPGILVGVVCAWIYIGVKLSKNPKDFGLLWIGAAGTIIAAIWFLFWVQRNVALILRGVEVVGRVNDIGLFSKNGMKSITVRYEYEGQVYRRAFMGNPEQYPMGAHVPLLIDPKSPKRFVAKAEL